jgi:hypothetical protein
VSARPTSVPVRAARWAAACLVTLALTGCGAGSGAAGVVEAPPPGAAFDYQLGGAYPPPAGVQVVARDATLPPAPGVYGICYVNGFQTQPGESARRWTEHRDLVLSADGRPVADPDWPDEYLLDTSTVQKRAALAAILADTVRGCAAAGYRAVELDNLDSWTRSDGRLTSDGALDLAARLADVAHAAGLAVGQKNAAELGSRGRDAGLDFAVTEECHRWDECAAYTDVYGDRVLDIEYEDDLRGTWADVCDDPRTPESVLLRDRLLTVPSDPDYAYSTC